jgi:ligand-binding sensor domain-containing protein
MRTKRLIGTALITSISFPVIAQEGRWQGFSKNECGLFVLSIVADSGNNVYVSCEERGIDKYDNTKWALWDGTKPDGLLDGFGYSLTWDSHGYLWCGTGRKGVALYDGSAWRKYDIYDGLSGWHVYSLGVDPKDGRVWIGTEGGLSVWDGKAFVNWSRDKDGLCSNRISAVAFHRETGNVWAASADKGICRLESSRWKCYNQDNSPLVSDQVNALCIDSRQHLWIATHGGISRINLRAGSKNWTTHDIPVELTDRYYTSVIEDAAGNIWIGTRHHGAWRLDVKKGLWEPFDKRNTGLPDDYVTCLTALPDGTVWAGTYGGGAAKIQPIKVVPNPNDPRWRSSPALPVSNR